MSKSIVVVVCMILLSTLLFGQENSYLSLQQAISTALQRNFDVISAQNALESRQASVTAAYGRFLPSVNANGNWNRSETRQPATAGGTRYINGIPIPIGATSGLTTNAYFSTGVNANVTLFDGFSNTASFNKSSNLAYSSEFDLVRMRQTIVLQTQTAYLQVLRNKSLLKVSEDNLTRSKQQLARIEESNKVGAVAKADLYRQQVQTANDELALITAQSAYDNSKQDLLYLLSLDVTRNYNINDPVVEQEIANLDSTASTKQITDYVSLVKQAFDVRPDFQSSVLKKQSAESDVTVARSSFYPSVSASLGYSMSNSELTTLTDNKTLSWGVSISLPLFNGFQTSTAIQSSQLALQIAEQSVEQTKRKVQVDIKKAILNLESAQKQLDVTLKNVFSAEEDRRIAEERYNLGAGTLLDLLVATANYTKARSDKVNASYDVLLARESLKFAVGSEKY